MNQDLPLRRQIGRVLGRAIPEGKGRLTEVIAELDSHGKIQAREMIGMIIALVEKVEKLERQLEDKGISVTGVTGVSSNPPTLPSDSEML